MSLQEEAIDFFTDIVERNDIVMTDITPNGNSITDYSVLKDLAIAQMTYEKSRNPQTPPQLEGTVHELFIAGSHLLSLNLGGKGTLGNVAHVHYGWIKVSAEVGAHGVRWHCYHTEPFKKDRSLEHDTFEFYWENGFQINTSKTGVRVKKPATLLTLLSPAGPRVDLFSPKDLPKAYALRFLRTPYFD